MTAHDSQKGSALPVAIAGMLVVGVALGAWWSLAERSEPGEAPDPTAAVAAEAPPAASPPPTKASPTPRGARAPAQSIADQGRLTVTRDALREGDVLALGLGLPDDLRGAGPRAVKVVDLSGRVFETEAHPVDGSGSGLRLEIDPAWLLPGSYMIQVETEGGAPLRIRRYVLEVSDDAAEAS